MVVGADSANSDNLGGILAILASFIRMDGCTNVFEEAPRKISKRLI